MGSELQLPLLDNPSLGELELDTTLRVKTREVLRFCLVICSLLQSTFLFLFSFSLMTAEQFAKNAAVCQSSVLQSVLLLCPWQVPSAYTKTYLYRVPNRLHRNTR